MSTSLACVRDQSHTFRRTCSGWLPGQRSGGPSVVVLSAVVVDGGVVGVGRARRVAVGDAAGDDVTRAVDVVRVGPGTLPAVVLVVLVVGSSVRSDV